MKISSVILSQKVVLVNLFSFTNEIKGSIYLCDCQNCITISYNVFNNHFQGILFQPIKILTLNWPCSFSLTSHSENRYTWKISLYHSSGKVASYHNGKVLFIFFIPANILSSNVLFLRDSNSKYYIQISIIKLEKQ